MMKRLKLHHIYFVLAAIDLITVACTLLLSHQMMSIHTQSVAANQVIAQRIAEVTALSELATRTNAPGNDVFDSRNVPVERARRDAALVQFNRAQDTIQRRAASEGDQELQLGLARINADMATMNAEADRIFQKFAANNADAAGQHMATMDRKFAQLNTSIRGAAQMLTARQSAGLLRQMQQAEAMRGFEWIIAGLIAFIVGCVLVYGHRIGAAMKAAEAQQVTFVQRLENEVASRTRQLQSAVDRAEEGDRAKSDFLANMSHEIRTPMNGIMGMAELLHRSELSPKQRNFAEVIMRSSRSLLTVINDILDFSKVMSGKVVLETKPVSLKAIISDIGSLLSTQIEAKNLEFITRFQPGLPEELIGDEGRIRQILLNLIGNAIKFTNEGHVLVNVLGVRRDDLFELEIRVEDTGIGIPPDKLEDVFEKFSQIDTSSTRSYEGTGLGLSICRMLTEKMGGGVVAESRLGSGSVFRVTMSLPVHREAREPARIPLEIGGARVLIIDDNAVNRIILEEQATSWGLVPVLCASGAEGLVALDQSVIVNTPFQLIILDNQMPRMSGMEAATLIRGNTATGSLPIIMLSSGSSEAELIECDGIGISAHLIKPAQSSLLFNTILEVITDARIETLRGKGSEMAAALLDSHAADATVPVAAEGGLKVLVAEDNHVNQLVIAEILQTMGYGYLIVANGVEAVDSVGAFCPDLILMDVSMPVMNGLDATAAIRALDQDRGRHTTIIGLTANVLKGDREKCLAAGMDDYLSKPIELATLEAAILKWSPQTDPRRRTVAA